MHSIKSIIKLHINYRAKFRHRATGILAPSSLKNVPFSFHVNKNTQAAACMNLEITQTETKYQQYYTDILDIYPMFLLQTYESL